MLQGEIVKETLRKYPDTPTLTLAKKIYRENSKLFNSIDTVRNRIRYYRGQLGKKKRTEIASSEFFKPEGPRNPFDSLPEEWSDIKDWKPYELSAGKWLILCDVHIPYYKREPFIIALKYALEHEITGIVLLGDIWDCYAVSRWDKDPRRRNLAYERDELIKVLEVIREIFPTEPIIYKLGNHEERLLSYFRVKAPELIDMEIANFDRLIEAQRFGIKVITERVPLKIGRLFLLHGHEFGGNASTPVNPARTLYLQGKEIALCGHYHRTSEHTEKSLDDSITACWSVGSLSDLHPEYRPINKWNHGFAIVDDMDGDFRVYNKKIINGKVY